MKIETGLQNYYGEVKFFEENGVYFMELGNWNGLNNIEISKEFYLAAQEEFVLSRADGE